MAALGTKVGHALPTARLLRAMETAGASKQAWWMGHPKRSYYWFKNSACIHNHI